MTHRIVVLVLLASVLPVAAQNADPNAFTGRIISVDRNARTITVETLRGLQEFEVDADDLVIEEVGPLEGYENDPSMKELRLGDLVRVVEKVPNITPGAPARIKRMKRQRTTTIMDAVEPGLVEIDKRQNRRERLPKTAGKTYDVALFGGGLVLLGIAVTVTRRTLLSYRDASNYEHQK